MDRIPFDPKEMTPVCHISPKYPGMPPMPIYDSPVSIRENYHMLMRGEKPYWMPHADELTMFGASCVPDAWARGMVTLPKRPDPSKLGGKDMFGVEWTFEPKAGGAVVLPGKNPVKDLEHWEDYVTFPDPDSWDWAGCAEETRAYREEGRILRINLTSGFFERLISFVGMDEAMMAMIDEDVQPAVHRLFDYLCGVYEKIFRHYKEDLDCDCVLFHDDWGSQRAPFFSLDTVREMIVPYLKRMVEVAHRYDMVFELHSCGCNAMLVPAMVEAGCDAWNGQEGINDKLAIAKQYGDKIIVDSGPDLVPRDASPEVVRAAFEKYLKDFEGIPTFVGMRFTQPAGEYPIAYELSRKAYNP